VAVNGQPGVRSMLNLTCVSDHRVWDGRAGETLMAEIKNIFESGAYEEVTLAGNTDIGAPGT